MHVDDDDVEFPEDVVLMDDEPSQVSAHSVPLTDSDIGFNTHSDASISDRLRSSDYHPDSNPVDLDPRQLCPQASSSSSSADPPPIASRLRSRQEAEIPDPLPDNAKKIRTHVVKDKNDVKMCPSVFRASCKALNFKPITDLFANAKHHQVPNYFSKNPDPLAVGCDALRHSWTKIKAPYINPPWDLIPDILRKVKKDKIRCMMVVPEWFSAPWWKKFDKLTESHITISVPLYLDDNGVIRPKPKWNTRIAILNAQKA